MEYASPAAIEQPPAPRAQQRPVTLSAFPGYAKYAWGVLGFNLFVILWGAFVRATGSGAGCGSHWPLCNGEIVPRAPATATVIEFGHRLTSGMDVILVAGLVAGAWRTFPRGHWVRRTAVLSAVFLVTEALIGAGLVLLEHVADDVSTARGYWVAGHLINTFVLTAFLTLTAWWASGYVMARRSDLGALPTALSVALLGVLLISVSGAVTALGDTLFPATSFAEAKAMTFSQTAHIFVRLRIWHPTLALVGGLLLTFASGFAAARRRTQTVQRLAIAVVSLYAIQLVIGAANVWFLAPVALQLLHLLLSDGIWILLVVLTAAALTEEASPATASPRPLREDPEPQKGVRA